MMPALAMTAVSGPSALAAASNIATASVSTATSPFNATAGRLGDRLDDGVGRFRVLAIIDPDRPAAPGRKQRAGAADAARSAGDEQAENRVEAGPILCRVRPRTSGGLTFRRVSPVEAASRPDAREKEVTSPLYIQQGPSPTWWNSPAIWVTARGDPSTGPKVISPIVGRPRIPCGSRFRTSIWRPTLAAGTCSCVGGFSRNAAIGQYRANCASTSAGPQGSATPVTAHPWWDFESPGSLLSQRRRPGRRPWKTAVTSAWSRQYMTSGTSEGSRLPSCWTGTQPGTNLIPSRSTISVSVPCRR